MSERHLVPEILDRLDPSDPEAIRSRADLRRLDGFLGNSRWILRMLRGRVVGAATLVELGAGEGILARRIAQAFPEIRVTGLDLAPRPAGLPGSIDWCRGDFFKSLPNLAPEVVVGSLILHHFSNEALRELGRHLGSARVVIFSEPFRSRVPHWLSYGAFPFVGRVTRHDMPVSIRAGFRQGELASALGLDSGGWVVRESCHWRGVIRMIGWRV